MTEYVITLLRTEKYVTSAESLSDAERQAKELRSETMTLVSVVELTDEQLQLLREAKAL